VDEAERAAASARRAFALLDRPSAIRDPEPGTEEHLPEAEAGRGREVRFEGVDFGYGGGREPIFEGLDLTVEAGTFVGVAGATGAGKTTLTKMVLRSYDPTGGAVRLDGVDLRALPLHELREEISLVSQDGYVFAGTLRENIAYGGRADATLDEVRRAAAAAHFDDFVMSLPLQYDTLVGERGVRLSGGQRQRLSIARAMLKASSLLILDEATASVDSKTERVIQRNLGRLIRGRTSIVIAHRLSTIRHADRIIVLDHGRVAEDGTHEELLSLRGRYFELWSTQTGEAVASTSDDEEEDEDDGVVVSAEV
jgi:ATP-binding cassette subfamily B protein